MENDEVKGLLTRQVMEPVRFYESVETMQKLGATRFIEVGPGRVLSGFIKKIDKNAEIANVENLASFEALISFSITLALVFEINGNSKGLKSILSSSKGKYHP